MSDVFYRKQLDGTFMPVSGFFTNEEKRLRKLKADLEWTQNSFHWQLFMTMVGGRNQTVGGDETMLKEYYREIAKECILATDMYFEVKGIL